MPNICCNKKDLINNLLTPISRMTDRCCLVVNKSGISSLSTTASKNPILYARFKCKIDLGDKEEITLNIPDVKRLISALNCTTTEDINLKINSNNLEYNNGVLRFQYHLLEDGALPKEIVNPDKINSLKYDGEFVISEDVLASIIKATSFTFGSDKIYFSVKDSNVFAELTDKEISNIDNMTYHITGDYIGEDLESSMPINVDILKMFGNMRNPVVVKINQKLKIMLFEVAGCVYNLQYIVTTLVK